MWWRLVTAKGSKCTKGLPLSRRKSHSRAPPQGLFGLRQPGRVLLGNVQRLPRYLTLALPSSGPPPPGLLPWPRPPGPGRRQGKTAPSIAGLPFPVGARIHPKAAWSVEALWSRERSRPRGLPRGLGASRPTVGPRCGCTAPGPGQPGTWPPSGPPGRACPARSPPLSRLTWVGPGSGFHHPRGQQN